MAIKIEYRKFWLTLLVVFHLQFLFKESCSQPGVHLLPVSEKSSFRALSILDDSVAWVSGNQGWFGRTVDGGKNWSFRQVPGFETLDFRSLYAFNAQSAIIANAGSPAHILYTTDAGTSWRVVYSNHHPHAFLDGIDFWNSKEGIVYGDPIEGRMMLLRTADGGNTWLELPTTSRPLLNSGEASFAASGTGIQCLGKSELIIATGGMTSRLFRSTNKGKSWRTQQPALRQGDEGTGIFSVEFYDQQNAMVVGGDFKKATDTTGNAAFTQDGGRTWHQPNRPPLGYRECVVYLNKRTLVTTGPSGTEISYDGGKNWQPLSNEGFHVVRKARQGSLVVLAGNEKLAVLKE